MQIMNLTTPRFGLRTMLAMVAACAFGLLIARVIWKSVPAASTLWEPPPLLNAEQPAKVVLLFDGKTTKQWTTVGEANVQGGNLELGGNQPSAAYFEGQFGMDFDISFDFFQDGPGAAEFRVKPILLDPNDKYSQNVTTDLNRSNFVYKRWHHSVAVGSYNYG